MQFYPAYTVRSVMDEYAITFFTLLNEGYRLKHQHYLMMARIVLLPNVKKEARSKFLKSLEYASKSPADILRLGSNNQDTDMSKVKKLLGG